MTGAVLRTSPIDGWAQAHGAHFGEAAGWRVVTGYNALEAEVGAARGRAALVDLSAMGKVQVEGEDAPGLVAGEWWRGEAGEAYAIRPDLLLVLTPPGGEGAALRRLEEARTGAAGLMTVTDMTHGLAALGVVGPRSRAVLRRLCALDLSEAAWPNGTARATSVAKTRQVIARRDMGGVVGFTLLGARSLAPYLWEVLEKTGVEFGLAPIGSQAMTALGGGQG
jgi:sarcosine oxidase subunit alpha